MFGANFGADVGRRARISGRRRLSKIVALALSAALLPISGASADEPISPFNTDFIKNARVNTAPWNLVSNFTIPLLAGSEGVASYSTGTLLYRGIFDVTLGMRWAGWDHIGDNDIANGLQYDSYQGKKNAKAFAIAKSGESVAAAKVYEHPLSPGEEYNNSFVTVSPDLQYLVSGTWETQPRFWIYPNPVNKPESYRVPTAGTIIFDRPLYRVQGCDFTTSSQLVCTTDDANNSVVSVTMSAPIHAGDNYAKVTTLFVPRKVSACSGAWESEGIDYNAITKKLTMTLLAPHVCRGAQTNVLVYQQ